MNVALDKAAKWLGELGIRTETTQSALKVNRDDVDAFFGIGVIYEEFLNELRTALDSKKLYWESKDREWLYLNSF